MRSNFNTIIVGLVMSYWQTYRVLLQLLEFMMVIQNVYCFKKKTSCLIYLSRISVLIFSLFLILPFLKNAVAGENIVTEIVGIGGLCLDLPYNNTANGADLWMWGCNETNAQS
jgi:hypothetical protein